MLFDSDVIIEHLRGNAHANHLIKQGPLASISSITYMEVIKGSYNKDQKQRWKAFLENFNINVIHINERISAKAMFWMDEFFLSYGLEIADALVAATADIYGLPLVTGNIKDYRFLPGLDIKPYKHQP